ncbi:MAG: hypothetical protein ABSG75_14385 [Syntrophales bacterium]
MGEPDWWRPETAGSSCQKELLSVVHVPEMSPKHREMREMR